MKIYYNDNYTASKYAFDTTRKSKSVASYLQNSKNITITDPEEKSFFKVAEKNLQEIHSPTYFNAVKNGTPKHLAQSQGFEWDKGVYTMAVSHTSGLIAATYEAIMYSTTAGSLSSGLHHAHINHGSGYCTFNGLGAAANYAVNQLGVGRVLIMDFDAHSGGGTYEIIEDKLFDNVVQIDVTCSAFDTFRPEGENSIWYTGHQDYRKDIDRALTYASKKLDKFDFIIYNAGMDPLNAGVSMADIIYRENAVRDFIGDTPAIFALAGGYTWGNKTMDEVVSWHAITAETWANAHAGQTTMV